jgi:glycosyltransferase involved in cell wall biosynthesis
MKKERRNKLIYLSYSRIPSQSANSLQVMQMCHAFAETGMQVSLYCLRTLQNKPAHTYYDLPISHIRLHRIWMPRIKIISRILYGLRVASSLLIRGTDGIFYGRDFYTLALLSLVRVGRLRIYFEAHQPPGDQLEYHLQKMIFNSTSFAGLICISQALKDEYLRLYPALLPEKVKVAHDGARPTDDVTEKKNMSEKQPCSIGYVGSLQAGKGMELIARLAPLLPEFTFHVVGGQADQLAFWSARCPENVHFHGHQPSSKARHLMSSFDILLAPYQPSVRVGKKQVEIARWMSPLKIFEYMAAAKAMVASDLPVLREVLVNGRNALLADPDRPDNWVTAIRQLATNDAYRQHLGQQAQLDFKNKYSWRQRAEFLREVFENQALHQKTSVI